MLDTEKANICTVMNTFGFDVVSGGLAIRGVFDSLSAYRHESAAYFATVRNRTAWVSSGCHHARC